MAINWEIEPYRSAWIATGSKKKAKELLKLLRDYNDDTIIPEIPEITVVTIK